MPICVSIRHTVLAAICCAPTLATQEPRESAPDPLALVTHAEALLKGNEPESAILTLWQTLAVLATLPNSPVNEAARLSARHLLTTHDPREAQRRAVFASIAKQQAELAALYRGKKWLEVAATRLAVADRYDTDVGAKERTLLAAALAKLPKAPVQPTPPPSGLCELLRRGNAEYVSGDWREVDDALECLAPTGRHVEWVARATHADHEIVVEFRPSDPTKDHNVMLAAGLGIREGSTNFSGYRLLCQYHAEPRQFVLVFFAVRGMSVTEAGAMEVNVEPSTDGYRRLSLQVRGKHLRAQLDGSKTLDLETEAPVRGHVGLLQGLTSASTCAARFRNFRIDPLPADMPTDEELRARSAAESQNAITKAVDDARELIAKQQPEPASLRLRDALGRVEDMAPGVLRDNLGKTIEQLLVQTDPYAARRKRAAQAIAGELVVLADEYAKAAMVRAAETLVAHATSFDPSGQAARLAAAREAVQKWNTAQAAARASDLLPPTDDGTALREWFAKGRKLDTRGIGFTVDGAVARTVNLGAGQLAAWLPQPMSKPLTRASVYVRVAAADGHAGLCFDVVDATQYGVVFLHRLPNAMRLHAYRQLAGKWVPLLHREVPMDAWRRDAWHQITVESTEQGLVARCGAAEIKVPRTMLGKATGTFGLFGSNNGEEPLPIEHRAFQPGQ